MLTLEDDFYIDFDLKRKRTIKLLFTKILMRIHECKICRDSTTVITPVVKELKDVHYLSKTIYNKN